MSKAIWKPTTILSPVPPALVSCGTLDKPNLLTIAWTGIVNTIPPMTYISVRPSRYSYNIIKDSGEFVINLPCADIVKAVDFCGVRSGKDMNKFTVTGLTPQASANVSAPSIKECPLSFECRVKSITHLGSHDMFLAEIVSVAVDEQFIDERGKLRLDKAHIIGFAHGEYYELGKKLGSFGYSVRKKSKPHKKHRKNK